LVVVFGVSISLRAALEQFAICRKNTQVVPPVRRVACDQRTLRRGGNRVGTIPKLSRQVTRRSKLELEHPGRVELLNSVVSIVRHIDVLAMRLVKLELEIFRWGLVVFRFGWCVSEAEGRRICATP
jgi:hypothetical protein